MALLTIWWTFGIGNVLYALKYHKDHERECERLRKLFARGGPQAILDDRIRKYACKGWKIQFQSETMTQLVRTRGTGRSVREEVVILEVDEQGRITKSGAKSHRRDWEEETEWQSP